MNNNQQDNRKDDHEVMGSSSPSPPSSTATTTTTTTTPTTTTTTNVQRIHEFKCIQTEKLKRNQSSANVIQIRDVNQLIPIQPPKQKQPCEWREITPEDRKRSVVKMMRRAKREAKNRRYKKKKQNEQAVRIQYQNSMMQPSTV